MNVFLFVLIKNAKQTQLVMYLPIESMKNDFHSICLRFNTTRLNEVRKLCTKFRANISEKLFSMTYSITNWSVRNDII